VLTQPAGTFKILVEGIRLKALEPIDGTLIAFDVTIFNVLQLSKAYSPILVMLAGIVILGKL